MLAVEESHINRRLQTLLKDENNSLRVDDAAKIVGCWKALAKLGIHEGAGESAEPMKRAVAFCQVIEPSRGGKTHKVSSKEIADMFKAVVDAYPWVASATCWYGPVTRPMCTCLSCLEGYTTRSPAFISCRNR